VFKFPFSDDEARQLVQQGPRLDDKALEDFGVRLYRAAFVDEIGTLFRLTDQEARRANRGLRLRLVLEAAELTELPWEIVRPPDWGYPPALSERMPLVRHIDLLGEHHSLDVRGTLRVLLVTAQPSDQQPLALKKEKQQILKTLKPLQRDGKILVTDLVRARKPAVLEALRAGCHHVLHFMMHADFDPTRERGALVLEGEDGRAAFLDAEEFALALDANPQMVTRLVIFNACYSANDSITRPGRGLAAAAVRLNLPAVVAMQYPISDPAAIEFAREVYVRLVKGQGIAEAIAFGRNAIRFNTEDSLQKEWIIPVLYLRSKNDHLFQGISANSLDYTEDATPARKLIDQVDRAPAVVKTGAAAPEVVVTIHRSASGDGRRFDVTLETPEGRAQGVLELTAEHIAPYVPPDAERGQEQDGRVPVNPGRLQAMGEDLFTRLFAGDLGKRVRTAQVRAREQGTGLRWSLVADDPVIDLVPWEFLRDPSKKVFLALAGASSPFLRRIDSADGCPFQPAPIVKPLRILFVSSQPRNLKKLNLEREWNWFQDAVQDSSHKQVQIDRLVDPTRGQIPQTLADGNYHVLHFAGYDAFCASHGKEAEGFVLLDEQGLDEQGRLDFAPYDLLTDLLNGIDSLRLVVANTCYTASQLAPALVRSGIPAVVGMRFGIKDDFAVRLTLLFYRALLKFDLDVAAALAAARKSLHAELDRKTMYSGNWTYPTLVTSVAGAQVFGRPR
jgi:CHAT domain-containing protein